MNLERSRKLLNQLLQQNRTDQELMTGLEKALAATQGYEDALIQMVQATRGYLHLVNVVLAGESEEFRRLASELRSRQSQYVEELALVMKNDSQNFQMLSNIFSIITIVLGGVAAWMIKRDIVPPLNAITKTFENLTHGHLCNSIPALERHDELGSLAEAAHIFKERAAETERLLKVAESSQDELNRLNQQLEEQTVQEKLMSEKAHAATVAKSEFLANMSHEIRTPMTAILGFNEILLNSLTNPDNIEAAKVIQRNGDYLLTLINDILDLSKIEAGKLQVESIECEPEELIADVVSLMKVRTDAKNLKLALQFEGEIPKYIQSDPTRIRQILINIVGNAIKFTEAGSVTIMTRLLDQKGESPLLEFSVIDTGIGIEQKSLENIFKPFTQADGSTTRKFGGTGLGLAICKRLVELLGGTFAVESEVGKGSVFRFSVATGNLENVQFIKEHVTARPAPERAKSSEQKQNSLEGVNVLLVEDGPDNQRLISFILSKAGATVTVAENGKLACDQVLGAQMTEEPFDVILMDMQMPVMDGYTAAAKLRELGNEDPIIALTAHAMNHDRQKCLDAGCDDYTMKPINRTELVGMVSKYASRNRKEMV
ncbi:MAG: ATP-binding protein [Planctomycetaceae bacterium]